MTLPFANSLGMVEPYGAIFGQPEPNSPAAHAGIQEGDVITAINGSSLRAASDFAGVVSGMAPGSLINLTTFRNRELKKVALLLGSSNCPNQQMNPASILPRLHPRAVHRGLPAPQSRQKSLNRFGAKAV
jgi:serine protease Do